MEINPIYNRYQTHPMGFETTLRLLQDLISERLDSNYSRIVVQASNSSRVRFCFTVFFESDLYNESGGFYSSYVIFTQEVKNFRNFRPDNELESEVNQLENLITTFRNGCLNKIIN